MPDRKSAPFAALPGVVNRKVRLIVYHTARIALGGIFLYASVDKILKPQAFAEAVYNYQILPEGVVNLAALVLPWVEVLIGICLIGGFWLPGATLLGTGLLTVFIGALVFNQARGIDVHCGCFSTGATAAADLWTVARDLAFLVVSVYLTVVTLIKPSGAK